MNFGLRLEAHLDFLTSGQASRHHDQKVKNMLLWLEYIIYTHHDFPFSNSAWKCISVHFNL